MLGMVGGQPMRAECMSCLPAEVGIQDGLELTRIGLTPKREPLPENTGGEPNCH